MCFSFEGGENMSNYPEWVEDRFGDDIPEWAEERWGDDDNDDEEEQTKDRKL